MKIKSLILLIFVLLIFVGCKSDQEDDIIEKQYEIYQLAKDVGYNGTYEEWLESIMGQQGEPGENGLSAYEIYVKYHTDYEKTEEEWIEDLINGHLIENTFTITFDVNGGQLSEDDFLKIITKKYDTINNLPIPIKEGYDFAGWVSGFGPNDGQFTVLTNVTKDIKLYAKWIEKTYTITFDSKGGSEVEAIASGYNEKITKPVDPIKEGFDFAGWYINEEFTEEFVFIKMPAEDFTLYAKWVSNVYVPTGEITIRIPSGVLSNPLQTLINSFHEKYPLINVQMDIVFNGYSRVRLYTLSDIDSYNAPDIVIGYPDHFAEYYHKNALVKLQDYIDGEYGYTQDELNDFVESYLEEGKGFDSENINDLYTLPFNKSTEVLIYNKTLMDALHNIDETIVIPKTWQELKIISEKINSLVQSGAIDNILGPGYGAKQPSELYNQGEFYTFSYDSPDNAFINFTYQWAGDYIEKISNSEVLIKINHDKNIEFLEYFQGEANEKRFAFLETFGLGYSSDAFIGLKTLMIIGSSAGVKYNIPLNDKFEVGISEIPYNNQNPEGKYVIQQGTNIGILNQNTDIEKLCSWLFIKHLLTVENSAKFAIDTGGYLPVRSSSYETTIYQDYLQNPPINMKVQSRTANVCLDYLKNGYIYTYEEPFKGSSDIRAEVKKVFVDIVVSNSNIIDRLNQAYETLS